jgi:hypothetical protein
VQSASTISDFYSRIILESTHLRSHIHHVYALGLAPYQRLELQDCLFFASQHRWIGGDKESLILPKPWVAQISANSCHGLLEHMGAAEKNKAYLWDKRSISKRCKYVLLYPDITSALSPNRSEVKSASRRKPSPRFQASSQICSAAQTSQAFVTRHDQQRPSASYSTTAPWKKKERERDLQHHKSTKI